MSSKEESAKKYCDKYLIGKTECAFDRTGVAMFEFCQCDITGIETLCVCMDSSENEYGYIHVSLNYINKLAQERNLLNVTKEEHDKDQKLLKDVPFGWYFNCSSDSDDLDAPF